MGKDLRYSRTEKHIKQAFIQLLKSKPYEKIKIADIIELAEISRNAFYLHYYSKDELLDSFIDSYAEQFTIAQDRILKENESRDLDVAKECIRAIIHPFYENKETSILLFKIYNGEIFSRKLANKLSHYFYSTTDKTKLSEKEQLDLKFYSEYRADGIIGTVMYNFLHGFPYDEEELAEFLHSMNTGAFLTSITPFAQK